MSNSDNGNTIFQKGERANADYFLGTVWVKNLVPADDKLNNRCCQCCFEAGARNNWHTHAGGQILIATEGTGTTRKKANPFNYFTREML